MPRSRWIVIVVVAALVVAAAVTAIVVLRPFGGAATPDRATRIVASDLSKAHRAASEAEAGSDAEAAAAYLSVQPTAVWLTPEAHPVADIPRVVAHLAQEARAQDARLGVVVYGLPARDCGNHSAGGLPDAEYAEWTAAIGEALRENADVDPIVVLEPDSLALAPECGNVEQRVALLTDAVAALAADTTAIYLDGGHSQWLPVAEMAHLIDRVGGAEHIRGFATNVSNFNATQDEVAYAHALSARLDGMHALIDTSRNGAGSNGEWCNPSGRRVGEPGGTVHDEVVDANLWIKPPGESDGPCNGGPAAGHWWPEGAVELTRDVDVDTAATRSGLGTPGTSR